MSLMTSFMFIEYNYNQYILRRQISMNKKVFDNFASMVKYNKIIIPELSESPESSFRDLLELENIKFKSSYLTSAQWDEIINKHHKNYKFLIALISNVEVPPSVILRLMNHSNILKSTKNISLNTNDTILLQAILSQKYNKDILEKITCTIPLNNICLALSKDYSNGTFQQTINQQYIDELGKIVFENIKNDDDYSFDEITESHEFLANISAETFHELADIALDNGFISSTTCSSLLSCKNLDANNPEDVEKATALLPYCDPLFFTYIPPVISKQLSEILYETIILSNINEQTNEFTFDENYNIFDTAAQLICGAITDGVISPAIEYDLGIRLLSMDIQNDDFLTQTVFSTTKNKDLLSRINELYPYNKVISILNNPNIPENILKKEAEKYCTKVINHSNSDNKHEIIENWINIVSGFVDKITLNDETYKLLINLGISNINSNIAMSSKTPDRILNDVIDFCKPISSIYSESKRPILLAYINKFCTKNNVDDKVKLLLNETAYSPIAYLKDQNNRLKVNGDHLEKRHSPYLTALNLDENIKFFIANTHITQIVNQDTELAKNISKYFKELLDNPDLSTFQDYFQRTIACLDYNIEFKTKLQEHNITELVNIKNPYKKFTDKLQNIDKFPYLYAMLPSMLKEYEIYSEIINRVSQEVINKQKENNHNSPIGIKNNHNKDETR